MLKHSDYYAYAHSDDDDINVQFISFNYTDIICRLINVINNNGYDGKITYEDPLYIHGKIDSGMIMGVDNESQIEFSAQDTDINENIKIMLKPELNDSIYYVNMLKVRRMIHLADKIIMYGLSVGDTDMYWWKVIAEWLNNATLRKPHELEILYYVSEEDYASATKLYDKTRVENLFSRLRNEMPNACEKNIYGSVNVVFIRESLFDLNDIVLIN